MSTTKIKKIVNLLATEELTSKEISEKSGIAPDLVYVYLNKLLNKMAIERTTDKKPYKYKKAQSPKELLKQLYDFMGEYMVIREDKKEEVKQHRDLIVKIKELIA